MQKFIVVVRDELNNIVQEIPAEAKGRKTACWSAISQLMDGVRGEISLYAETLTENKIRKDEEKKAK